MENYELFYGNTRICRGDIRYNTKNHHEVVGVITAADKPAGRGQKLKYSAVRVCAK
jgi:methionyl-tRNA formyltransferase